jgi:hypothetical protein
MRNQKRECLCTDWRCAKCLVTNCEDDYCKVHSTKDKVRAKEKLLQDLIHTEDSIEGVSKNGILEERLQDYWRMLRKKRNIQSGEIDLETRLKEDIERLKRIRFDILKP